MPDVLSIADTTVSAGAFNRRITIQRPDDSATDSQGGATRAWVDVVSTWAHIEPWKGSEIFIAQQVYPNKIVRMLIRYRPSMNIDASMRIVYGSQLYNIRSVTVPAEARTTIEIVAEELQARGSTH
jgi:SPP1 family predicted phage head-tail adaptor